jgi:diguanylate cyclase (GGDEF)-like protein
MNRTSYHVLLLEDSGLIRRWSTELLEGSKLAFFETHEARSLAEGLKLLENYPVDAVLLDLGLPDSEGLDTLRAVHKASPQVAVVILTADDSDETVMEAMREGTQDYLLKDEISGPLLQRTIRYAIEHKRLEEELRYQADIDGLTELYSRRHLMDVLDEAIEAVSRAGGSLSLCLCDVDNLKRVNDTFGHRMGDETLAHLGAKVRAVLEAPCFAGRYGGDEFVLVFPGIPPNNAVDIVEALRRSFEDITFRGEDGETFGVTCTFGIAGVGPGRKTAKDLIHAADEALYGGKDAGRNRVVTK